MHKCCIAQRRLYASEANKASDFVGENIANPLPWKPYPACLVAVYALRANIHGPFWALSPKGHRCNDSFEPTENPPFFSRAW